MFAIFGKYNMIFMFRQFRTIFFSHFYFPLVSALSIISDSLTYMQLIEFFIYRLTSTKYFLASFDFAYYARVFTSLSTMFVVVCEMELNLVAHAAFVDPIRCSSMYANMYGYMFDYVCMYVCTYVVCLTERIGRLRVVLRVPKMGMLGNAGISFKFLFIIFFFL